jgi:hypothetical protein
LKRELLALTCGARLASEPASPELKFKNDDRILVFAHFPDDETSE